MQPGCGPLPHELLLVPPVPVQPVGGQARRCRPAMPVTTTAGMSPAAPWTRASRPPRQRPGTPRTDQRQRPADPPGGRRAAAVAPMSSTERSECAMSEHTQCGPAMHNTQVCGPHVELTGRRLRMALQSSRWPEITGNLARVIQLLKLDGILGPLLLVQADE